MARSFLSQLAIPAVILLISFLSYSSQLLFLQIEPRHLQSSELIKFNILLACIWISYARACMVDPGNVPPEWTPDSTSDDTDQDSLNAKARQRWCRKCNTIKPPRSHHCKICKRCIPKMDHHCPWTSNCVSHFTFPHFMRFLVYCVVSMVYLQYFLFQRCAVLWEKRKLPSYMGPSVGQLILLFGLVAVNTVTLIAVGLMFLRTAWGLGGNVTTIESWEIERHFQLLRRARVLGGFLDGPDGQKIRIRKQEFPYDIGIWNNIKQGMGTGNVIAWFYPFASTPNSSGLSFDVNDFEDHNTSWPPPDPDRMPRLKHVVEPGEAFTYGKSYLSNHEEVEAFKKRQQNDLSRRQSPSAIYRRKPFHTRYSTDGPTTGHDQGSGADSGEESWQDTGGNRLKDYGIDEDIEFYDEDDVPLAVLIRRRQERQRQV